MKYIITSLIAILAILTSCNEKYEPITLDEIRVSSSYVAIPATGGKVDVKMIAIDSWNITEVPAWLSVSDTVGNAGEVTLSFSAEASKETNSCTVKINCAGKTQLVNVVQMTEKMELPIYTCDDVNASPDGVTYRVKGVVTKISNDMWGNWYLNDGTVDGDGLYIYGTLDAAGAEKNFLSLGIEPGDIVTVEGPKSTYQGMVELVNVTVVNIEKSLIKADSLSVATIPMEGGEFTVYLTCKGDGVSVEAPAEWLSVKSVKTSGTSAEVTFKVSENEGGARDATLTFVTTKGGVTYTSTSSIYQEGAIPDAAAKLNAKAGGAAAY